MDNCNPPRSPRQGASGGLAEFSRKKKLGIDWLRKRGLHDLPGGGIGITYRSEDGADLFVKTRDVPGRPRFEQPAKTPLMPFGLQWLDEARKAARLVITEGESDTLTLRAHGIPALAIPGSNAARCLQAEHLSCIENLDVCPDNDDAGKAMLDGLLKRLGELGFAGRVRLVKVPPGKRKDVSDWYVFDAPGFPSRWRQWVEAAELLHVPTPAKPGPKGKKAGKAKKGRDAGRVGDRTPVEVTPDEALVVEAVASALAGDDLLFQREEILLRVVAPRPTVVAAQGVEAADAPRRPLELRRPPGLVMLRPAPAAFVRTRITAACYLYRLGDDGQYQVNPPDWLAPQVLASPGAVRQLDGLLLGPTLDADGRLIEARGYDAATRLYLARPLAGLSLPERPGLPEARAAARTLAELVGDFPFATGGDRSRWLCLLLAACCRHLLDKSPLGLITANQAGAGKTRLACLISIISHGLEQPIMMSWPEGSQWQARGDEIRKRLASLLHEGATQVLMDNLPRGEPFGGPEVDGFLTGDTYYDRQLGRNDGLRVGGANRCLLLATGNNVTPRGDTADRTLLVSLYSEHANPRSLAPESFRLPEIERHVMQRRADYLGAALTIWRAWIVAGYPRPGGVTWGSFEGFADSVVAAVRWLDLDALPDPIEDRSKKVVEMDVEAQALAWLVSLWTRFFGDEPLRCSELLRRLDPGETDPFTYDQKAAEAIKETLQELGCRKWPPTPRWLGGQLRGREGQVVSVDDGAGGHQPMSIQSCPGGNENARLYFVAPPRKRHSASVASVASVGAGRAAGKTQTVVRVGSESVAVGPDLHQPSQHSQHSHEDSDREEGDV
jgi:hypothetical protein